MFTTEEDFEEEEGDWELGSEEELEFQRELERKELQNPEESEKEQEEAKVERYPTETVETNLDFHPLIAVYRDTTLTVYELEKSGKFEKRKSAIQKGITQLFSLDDLRFGAVSIEEESTGEEKGSSRESFAKKEGPLRRKAEILSSSLESVYSAPHFSSLLSIPPSIVAIESVRYDNYSLVNVDEASLEKKTGYVAISSTPPIFPLGQGMFVRAAYGYFSLYKLKDRTYGKEYSLDESRLENEDTKFVLRFTGGTPRTSLGTLLLVGKKVYVYQSVSIANGVPRYEYWGEIDFGISQISSAISVGGKLIVVGKRRKSMKWFLKVYDSAESFVPESGDVPVEKGARLLNIGDANLFCLEFRGSLQVFKFRGLEPEKIQTLSGELFATSAINSDKLVKKTVLENPAIPKVLSQIIYKFIFDRG